MVFDKNSKTFVMYVAALEILLVGITIHSLQTTHITGSDFVQVAVLQQNKASIEIPSKYADYVDVFLFKPAMELLENTGINKYVIELEDGKQPSYGPIYSLKPVELETLKTYIKTYLKIGFIQSSKSPVGILILFDKKLDGSFCLYIDY